MLPATLSWLIPAAAAQVVRSMQHATHLHTLDTTPFLSDGGAYVRCKSARVRKCVAQAVALCNITQSLRRAGRGRRPRAAAVGRVGAGTAKLRRAANSGAECQQQQAGAASPSCAESSGERRKQQVRPSGRAPRYGTRMFEHLRATRARGVSDSHHGGGQAIRIIIIRWTRRRSARHVDVPSSPDGLSTRNDNEST